MLPLLETLHLTEKEHEYQKLQATVSYLVTRLIKVAVSWDVTTCIILEICQCFEKPSVSDLKVGKVSGFLRNVSIFLINTFQVDKAVCKLRNCV